MAGKGVELMRERVKGGREMEKGKVDWKKRRLNTGD